MPLSHGHAHDGLALQVEDLQGPAVNTQISKQTLYSME